ncbi:LysM peptidoglycan-binding domain-containing protein [Actinomyces howellii]|uniref:LysM domain n=1 Tax=Actinomyces howellii TaxID=52771 RepID=A0A3S5EGV0_9ACTO|nr:LysM peptidoglycan-binding domain-containing protein [Actinomyces howellii]VEG25543.1 LysM domain [Actinomyces howellii]
MSALVIPPSPRLRLVPATDVDLDLDVDVAGPAEPAEAGARGEGRAHLRLVTSADRAGGVQATGALAPRAARRPAAPRPHGAVGRGGARLEGLDALDALDALETLAPNHPAVRARRRSPAPVVRGDLRPDGAGEDRLVARRAARAGGSGAPVVLRRLAALGAGVLAAAAIVAAGIVVSGVDSAVQRTTTATVGQGQSLWDLAAATGASDVDEAMAQIVELNGLSSSTLQPGQTLLVPVQ